ncbi:glyoxalase [Fibrella sp. WM1]|uniref:glyoxalase n=1 Tax=Fibrella musci TaxID=3242485 RepID=UPI003520EA9C
MTDTTQTRDETLVALRPAVATEPITSNPAEAFQNDTLRPILKLQNELLLGLFRDYLTKRKQLGLEGRFAKLPRPEQEAYIDHSIRTDQKFKNLLVGVVIGQFTTGEWTAFRIDEAELTRRLVDLIVQRLCSQIDLMLH